MCSSTRAIDAEDSDKDDGDINDGDLVSSCNGPAFAETTAASSFNTAVVQTSSSSDGRSGGDDQPTESRRRDARFGDNADRARAFAGRVPSAVSSGAADA